MSEFEDVEKLIRLKRYEQPPKGFYKRFLAEFQSRQRSEIMRQSARGLFFERVNTWLWGIGHRRWIYAGGVAYAAVMIVVFLMPWNEDLPSSRGSENTLKMEASGKPAEDEPESPAEARKVSDDGSRNGQGALREL